MSKFAIRVLGSILHFFAQQRIKRPEQILVPSKFFLLLTDDNNKPATLKKIATWWRHKQPITWESFWVCAYFLQCWWKANGWMMIAKEAISSSQMNVHLMDCLPPPKKKKKSEENNSSISSCTAADDHKWRHLSFGHWVKWLPSTKPHR